MRAWSGGVAAICRGVVVADGRSGAGTAVGTAAGAGGFGIASCILTSYLGKYVKGGTWEVDWHLS